MDEMALLGLADISMDSFGNVTATLPASAGVNAPIVALIAHMDTAPDAPGCNVCPRIVRYDGQAIHLRGDVWLNEKLCPDLSAYIGKDIICTDGTTLLGADDKAGIAEILTAVAAMNSNETSHGEVRLVFTTDEEIGRGTDGLDVAALGCDYAFTVDGGELGELEYENFNAATGTVRIKGIGAHPGFAKGIMVNAAKIAAEFVCLIPQDECPERTDGYEGFFHLCSMSGGITEATLTYIIRDHDRKKFEDKKRRFTAIADVLNEKYGEDTCAVILNDTYYNMRESIAPHLHIVNKARAAFLQHGIQPITKPIRGGTDGAKLSLQGLPCPNISAGGFNAHSIREWIPVEALDKMADVIITLIESFVV